MASRSEKLSADDLAKQIIELGQNKKFSELQELISKNEGKLVSY